MLKYLVILLDDSSVSYCHYNNKREAHLMPIDTLQEGILFAMKHDLKIQYVLPPHDLPEAYMTLMGSMFHDNIGPMVQEALADVVVVDGINDLVGRALDAGKRHIVRTSIRAFLADYKLLGDVFEQGISVNVVFTDVEDFADDMIEAYQHALRELSAMLKAAILSGRNVNTNLLTDRIALEEMNNCGAGDTSITLAPDGKFYPCPAFYYTQEPYADAGTVSTGLHIRNERLYTLAGAPLCRRCDAYHCKRCVWLNKKLTYELGIPSRQQCVMAHVERNASRELLEAFHQMDLLQEREIEQVDYIDPFDAYQEV